jgi:hypothetical protein
LASEQQSGNTIGNRRTRRKLLIAVVLTLIAGIFLLVAFYANFFESTVFIFSIGTLLFALCVFLYFFNRVFLVASLMTFMPFTRGAFQFELGVITFSPFSMGLIGLTILVVIEATFRPAKRKCLDVLDFMILLLGLCYLISTLMSDELLPVGFVAFQGLFMPICAYLLLKFSITSRYESGIVIGGIILGATLFGLTHIAMVTAAGSRVIVMGVPAISSATVMVFPIVYLVVAGSFGKFLGRLMALPTVVSLVTSFSRAYLLSIAISPVLYKFCSRGKGVTLFLLLLLSSFAVTIMFTTAADSRSSTYFGFAVPKGELGRSDLKEAEGGVGRLTSGSHIVHAIYGRALAQQYALSQFLENPVFGTGIRPNEYGLATQHNFHIEWLQYGGIVGYLIYGGVILIFFRKTKELAKTDKTTTTLQVSVLVILINGVTNGLMHGYMPLVMFTLMGLAMSRRMVLNN